MNFKIIARDICENEIRLPQPISVEISAAYDAPANSLHLKTPCPSPLPELYEISVFTDCGALFYGIVDEQNVGVANGAVLEIVARSHAALLLDNEAQPGTYRTPSLADIFSLHAKPYGIKKFTGSGRAKTDFTVKKGMSEWEVIETFCKSVMNKNPIVTYDLVLDAGEHEGSGKYIFSNTCENGIRYSSAVLKRSRYGVVSTALYKLSPNEGYSYEYKNDDAEKRKIIRRRFLNLSGTDGALNGYKLQKTVLNSKRDSFKAVVKIPGLCRAELYAKAAFLEPSLGEYDDLCVAESKFSFSQSGVYTLLTVCPAENIL